MSGAMRLWRGGAPGEAADGAPGYLGGLTSRLAGAASGATEMLKQKVRRKRKVDTTYSRLGIDSDMRSKIFRNILSDQGKKQGGGSFFGTWTNAGEGGADEELSLGLADADLDGGADYDEKVRKVVGQGQHVEFMSLEIFKIMTETELPNFIDQVVFDKDGGLDRIVATLWTPQKYVWCLFLFLGVAFNVSSILLANWLVFESVAAWLAENSKHAEDMFKDADMGHPAQTFAVENNMFKNIQDQEMRTYIMISASVVGFVEVVYILYEFVVLLYRLVNICMIGTSSESQYWAYRFVMKICHQQLPNLSTFSAIKLMAKVHPGLIGEDFKKMHLESRWRTWACCRPLVTLYFAVERLLCMSLAVIAFAVKMITVCFKLIDPGQGLLILRFLAVVALLNQCMGVVMLSEVLEKRVFLFIFGGCDSDYQDDERAFEVVYRCRLVQKVHQDLWCKGKKAQAFALLTTLDHFDIQALLLEKPKDDDDDVAAKPAGRKSLSSSSCRSCGRSGPQR